MGVVAFAVAAAHWPALSAGALSFDDRDYLTENHLIQHPSWASAGQFLREILTPSTVGGYYQPLSMISLMLDYAVAGRPDNLRPFHVTSLALHVVNTMLIIALLYMLFGNAWAAAMAGLLFGVHPITVESIPWVAERKTLLAAFFAFWALILYIRYTRRRGWLAYAGCCTTYLLAVLSKPSAIPLPIVMLLLDFWPLRRLAGHSVLEKLPLFAVGAVSAIVTYVSQHRTAVAVLPTEYDATELGLIFCYNIVFYLQKVFWPVHMSAFYPCPSPLSLSNRPVLAGVIGTAVLIPALAISLRWTRSLLAGWLIFFVTILPAMQLIGFTRVVAADRFAYLPLIGLLVPLAWTLSRIWNARLPARPLFASRAAVIALALAVAGLSSIHTHRYASCWQDTPTLYRYMLAVAPDVPELHNALGSVLLEQSDRQPSRPELAAEAMAHFREAIRLQPDYADPYNNLGLALGRQGKTEEAAACLKTALRLQPNHAEAHNNLGNALADLGRLNEATAHYAEALRLKPHYARAHANLADVLLRDRRPDEAVEHYTRALALDPRLTFARIGMGHALYALGRTEHALAAYREAVGDSPDDPGVHLILAIALHESERFDEAIEEYRNVLRLDPGRADVAALLAAAKARKKAPPSP